MKGALECAVPDCHVHVPAGKLMCLGHWGAVTLATQVRVVFAYRAWTRDMRSTDKMRGTDKMRAYQAARDDALAEV